MDWLDRMNNAMNYIESNLANEISYDKAAQIACCSTYHFQRMFSFITGVPLSEYIRRRRLTLAAFDLQSSDIKVIDAAVKYGYESPEAFSRAFKNLHGIMPILARNKGIALTAYPRMTFQIYVKGVIEMNYKIEEKPAFTVFGASRKINRSTVILGNPKDEVGNFWTEIIESGELGKIESIGKSWADITGSDKKEDTLKITLEMSWHGENGEAFSGYDDTIMPYLIGSFKKDGVDTTGYLEVKVPAATWAVFPTKIAPYGSGKIAEYMRETNDSIWAEWFPTSGYESAELPHLGVFICKEGEYVEYWIPVKMKLE